MMVDGRTTKDTVVSKLGKFAKKDFLAIRTTQKKLDRPCFCCTGPMEDRFPYILFEF